MEWPGDGEEFLGATLARLSRAPSEVLVLTVHDQLGRFCGSFEFAGGGGALALSFRSVIQCALVNRASGVVLIHNHPSGDATPSPVDVAATCDLIALCRPLELQVHDHLVVGRDHVVSMRRAGILTDGEARGSGKEVRA